MNEYTIATDAERDILKNLEKKRGADIARIKRYLSMPDLSRTHGSPLKTLVDRVKTIGMFKDFDDIKIPEVVPADVSFDLFDFPKDHPARSTSDTYYVDEKNILRTHTTVMWYYHLRDENVKKRMASGEAVGCFSFGKVYRKDEIDRRHMNVFHQLDGWYLAPKQKRTITVDDLKKV